MQKLFSRAQILQILLLASALLPWFLCGQGTFNLVNQRNHPELSWSVYETAHFRIIYSNRLDETAKKAGSIAEQVYENLQKNLGLSFFKKYSIFIADTDDLPVGGTSPYGYMFCLARFSGLPLYFTGSTGWLQKVIAHELVHALIVENTRSKWDFLFPFQIFSFGSYLQVHEGMAQFYSGEKWGLERGDLFLNLAVRNSDMAGLPDDMDYGKLQYAKGFSQIKWLRRSATDRQLGQIFQLKNKWHLYSFGKEFKKATGKTYDSFLKEWQRNVNVYYNWREAVSERTESVGQVLEELPEVVFSVIHASQQPGVYAFTAVDSATSPDQKLYLWQEKKRMRILAQKGIQSNFSFCRDGKKIAFSRLHRGSRGSLVTDIYLLDIPSGKQKQLTRNFRAKDPVFIEGDWIVFIAQDGEANNIFLCNAEGKEMKKLTSFDKERYFLDMSPSPRGKKVIVSFLDVAAGSFGIVIYDIETRNLREVHTPELAHFPLFSPDDDDTVIYTSREEDVTNLFRLDLHSGTREPVTCQSNFLRITDWGARDRALGVRQVQRNKNEAFSLDPWRKPQSFPATLQPYYSSWKETTPHQTMKIEDKDVPGRYLGKFHTLSTFRPLQILPLPAYLGDRFTLGLMGRAADMPGKNECIAAVAFDFKNFSRTNYLLGYINRATRFDIGLSAGAGLATSYPARKGDRFSEFIHGAAASASIVFENPDTFNYHHILFGCSYEKSDPMAVEDTAPVPPAIDKAEPLPPPLPYSIASLTLAYRWLNAQPFLAFPLEGTGLRLEYQYNHSLSGNKVDYHYFHIGLLRMLPLAGKAGFSLSANLQAIQGTIMPQQRLGVAKYYTANLFSDYSREIYIRGGENYFPGNRLLTVTVELHQPVLLDFFNAVAFVDAARIWQGSLSGWKAGTTIASCGFEIQLRNTLDKSTVVAFGIASNITPKDTGRAKYYLVIKRSIPL